jgi:hypothetical protein
MSRFDAHRSALLLAVAALGLVLVACDAAVDAPSSVSSSAPSAGARSSSEAAPPRPVVDLAGASPEACVEAARECARRLTSQELEAFADCMPAELVRMLGGREGAIATLERGAKQMAVEDARIESAEIDPPTRISVGTKRTFAILPQRVTVRSPEGRLVQRSFLLGVLGDDGKTWKFVDGVKLDRATAERLFPDLPDELTLPISSPPELAP